MSKFTSVLSLVLLVGAIFESQVFAASYCPTQKKYTSCEPGYYMSRTTGTACNTTPVAGNVCRPCSNYGSTYVCAGGTACPESTIARVTYNLNGGAGVIANTKQNCTRNQPCELNPGTDMLDVYRNGYILVGWSTKPVTGEFVSGEFTMTFSEDTVVYAAWKPCAVGTYKDAGQAVAACKSCPELPSSKWKYTGENAATSYTSCQTSISLAEQSESFCSAGSLVRTATSPTEWGEVTVSETDVLKAKAGAYVSGMGCAQCEGAVYSAGGTVTSCTACPSQTSGWTLGTGTGWSSYASCYQTKPATSVSSYCSAGALKQVASSASAWGTATVLTVFEAKAGAYVTGTGASTTCSQCGSGNYCTGGTTAPKACSTLASGFYPNSAAGSDAETDCYTDSLSGKYVASAKATSATNCTAGTFKAAHTVKYGSTSSCGVCADNTYSNSGAASCTACATEKGYKNTGASATNHAGVASCKVNCVGGSYVATANAACTPVGAGYWAAAATVAQGDTSIRNACTAGLTTIGTGTGADEAGDCGRVLNFNGQKIYLRSDRKTTKTLNVGIDGKIYYGNMGTASKGSLRVNVGGTTYSVYDDSM